MKITIIGTGNVGGALARKFLEAHHEITLGVRNLTAFKGREELAALPGLKIKTLQESVGSAEVIVLSVPSQSVVEVAKSLGDVSGKVIIDTMNSVRVKPEGFSNTADALLASLNTTDIVKCFNTTGFENLLNPAYGSETLDMFTAGSSEKAVSLATRLAQDIGFKKVYHFGGNDKFELIEQMAMCWINLAILQKTRTRYRL